jgi:quaternary ammonium compound-resistance protein SugE
VSPKAWVVLIIAGLLEPVWATALKYSEGFTRFWPSVIGLAVSQVSLFLLTRSLTSLPAGTAYAVWVGIGACGVAVVGIALFGERVSLVRLGCVVLILTWIIGLKLVDG